MQSLRYLLLFILVSAFTCTYGQLSAQTVNDTLTLTVKDTTKGSEVTLFFKGKKIDSVGDVPRGNGKLLLSIKANNKPVRMIWQRNSPSIYRKDLFITKDTSIELDVSREAKDTVKNAVFALSIFNTAKPAALLRMYGKLTIPTTPKSVSEPEGTVKVGDLRQNGSLTNGRLPFIDSAMTASVSAGGACQSCNLSAVIDYKRDSRFSTDYFILFDRSHRRDAFTICKHIFRDTLVTEQDGKQLQGKNRNKIVERYRKVRPAYFAPKVGSQVSFEVINFSLLETLSIVTDSGDLFLNSAGFQSVLTTRLNATILNTAGTTGKASETQTDKKDGAGAQSLKPEDDTARLIRLYGELATYVRTFSGSSCTIDQHKINSILILNRIQEQFGLAGPLAQVAQQLSAKFKGTSQQQVANDVGVILAALDELKPLVYATPRLANRDFMNIKVMSDNNSIIANQNIRTSFGLKIDFSSGLFLTGLRDFSYIFKDTTIPYKPADTTSTRTDTSGRIIARENSGRLNLGFGFLAHVYPRFSSNYNIGLATGFMATTNLDLNILLGGSVLFQSLFGANTRVAFTGGIAWGKVSRLSNSMYEGLTIIEKKPVFYPTSVTAPSVVKVWEKSWFFGITYNF